MQVFGFKLFKYLPRKIGAYLFASAYKKLSKEAKDYLRENYGDKLKLDKANKKKKEKPKQPAISETEVRKWNTILKNSNKILNFLLNERGINQETIDRYQIGWDGSRITIPIRAEDGKIRNVRKYKPDSKGQESKVISYGKGYGSARLYPYENLAYEEILLVEGEMDLIRYIWEALLFSSSAPG